MSEPDNKKRIYKTIDQTQTIIDHGKPITHKSEHIEMGYAETEPAYIKVYLDTVLHFKGLSTSFSPILIALCRHMYFANGDQMLFTNTYIKQDICNVCNVSIKRVEQAIKGFVKVGILHKMQRGVYIVNPYIISRGNWEDIKVLRGKFDFMTGDIDVETDLVDAIRTSDEVEDQLRTIHKEINEDITLQEAENIQRQRKYRQYNTDTQAEFIDSSKDDDDEPYELE